MQLSIARPWRFSIVYASCGFSPVLLLPGELFRGSSKSWLWFDSGTTLAESNGHFPAVQATVEPNCNKVRHSKSKTSEVGLTLRWKNKYKKGLKQNEIMRKKPNRILITKRMRWRPTERMCAQTEKNNKSIECGVNSTISMRMPKHAKRGLNQSNQEYLQKHMN